MTSCTVWFCIIRIKAFISNDTCLLNLWEDKSDPSVLQVLSTRWTYSSVMCYKPCPTAGELLETNTLSHHSCHWVTEVIEENPERKSTEESCVEQDVLHTCLTFSLITFSNIFFLLVLLLIVIKILDTNRKTSVQTHFYWKHNITHFNNNYTSIINSNT